MANDFDSGRKRLQIGLVLFAKVVHHQSGFIPKKNVDIDSFLSLAKKDLVQSVIVRHWVRSSDADNAAH